MTSEKSNEISESTRERFSSKRLLLAGAAALIVVAAVAVVSSQVPIVPVSAPPSATFDFDIGSPVLAETQNTPLNQTSNGVTAFFGSPSDTVTAPAFSIQSYDTTFIRLPQFSGKYLYDNKPSRDILEIRFSQPLKKIALTFATVEYKAAQSNIELTAYTNSADSSPVGSTTARGAVENSLYPQGTLSFNSGDEQFNFVRIWIPSQVGEGATNFFVDNIIVTTTEQK